ncbi:hypothetical protein [Halorussus aquaticus]|uniref:Uncharacterized protein n=2 Tax=Halorussus aquaticus TaxID=2953748 RepID=A0ABD5Q6W2_9EURY
MSREPNSGDGETDGSETDDQTDREQAAKAAEAIREIGAERLADEIVSAWQKAGIKPFDTEEDDTGPDDERDPADTDIAQSDDTGRDGSAGDDC